MISYAIPIIRIVDRTHQYRLRRKQHELEEMQRKQPPLYALPQFNKHPWPWRGWR